MRYRAIIYSILAAFSSVVFIAIAGVAYTGSVNAANDRRWCEFLIIVNQASQSSTIQTEFGKKLVVAISKLQDEFGC